MGRKIKSIVLLIVILVLIYCQQTPMIYAEEDGGEAGKTEENAGEEGGLGENAGESAGEEGETEEVQLEKYQLEFPEADGKEGYYVKIPEIRISHRSQKGVTVYELIGNGKRMAEGRLQLQKKGDVQETVVLGSEQIQEGNNVLNVYMEDEDGVRKQEYDCVIEFKVDTLAPRLKIDAPGGFDTWYQKEAWIQVEATDNEYGSEIDSIACYCGNQIVGIVGSESVKRTRRTTENIDAGRAEFLIQQTSDSGNGVPVTIAVTDKAGNKKEETRKLYIDSSAPVVNIEGVTDYMITSQPVTVTYKAVEDNVWKECIAQTEYEDIQGEKQILPEGEWKNHGKQKSLTQTFSEDGIYRMKASAQDAAGYQGKKEAQVIIDSQNPVIRYVDQLDGQFMKKFCWDYPTETFIKDFTTFVYQMQLDGRMYPVGTQIDSEGHHILSVEAVDAAGNRACAQAGFVIDHTAPGIRFVDVEEGGSYEGERTFSIMTADTDDILKKVRINGNIQALKKENGKYKYTVCETGNYEVEVWAEDRAGNRGYESIVFEVVPRPTVLQKAAEPIRKMFSERMKAEGEGEKPDSRTVNDNRWTSTGVFFMCVIVGGIMICGVAGGIRYKKRHGEREE